MKIGQHTSDRKSGWKASISAAHAVSTELHGETNLPIRLWWRKQTPAVCILSFVNILFDRHIDSWIPKDMMYSEMITKHRPIHFTFSKGTWNSETPTLVAGNSLQTIALAGAVLFEEDSSKVQEKQNQLMAFKWQRRKERAISGVDSIFQFRLLHLLKKVPCKVCFIKCYATPDVAMKK